MSIFQWRLDGFSQKIYIFTKLSEYSSSKIKVELYCTFCIFGHFFENRKNSGLTPGQNDDPVTRWPGRERWPKWPIDPWPNDPVPCLSVTDNNIEYVVSRRVFESPNAFGGRAPPGPVERAWALPRPIAAIGGRGPTFKGKGGKWMGKG